MSELLDLDAIEARANEATAGEWRVWTSSRTEDRPAVETAWSYESDGDAEFITDCCSVSDAEFIAHSRSDIPMLIARIRELEPRVLEGDWETVRDALDALPEGAQIRWQTGYPIHTALAINTPNRIGESEWAITGYIGRLSSENIARDETPIEVIA